MRSLNPGPENCRRNGVIGLGLIPNHGPRTINIKISHGLNQYEVFVPSSSSFGYLKSFICQKIGLRPERHKLFFTCKEKEDDEDLQAAGLTDNSEVLLMEAKACQQESPEEMQETSVISKGEEAVAQVRNEVDKLARKVCAMQALVDRGIKVGDKEVGYLSEMLMRQLLKLDGIEAEGEGRVQRKMEVRRVQSLVDTLDVLKSINSNDFSSASKSLTPDYKNDNASSPLSYNIPSSYVPFPVSFQLPSSSKI